MIIQKLMRIPQTLLKGFASHLVAGGIPLEPRSDPSSFYMQDPKLRTMLIAELTIIAQDHFTRRLGYLSPANIDFAGECKRFMEIYQSRPFQSNLGGSGFHNAFWLYLIMRALQPELIVESGVFRGQTSWLLEQAAPRAKLLGFDIDLSRLELKQGRARFHEHDWTMHDVGVVDPDRSFAFFDCHVNHAARILLAHERGFRHLLFDDDPPLHKLYRYARPGIPTAKMIWDGLKDFEGTDVSWTWNRKNVKYELDLDQVQQAKSLMKTHEVFPDVGGPSLYGGFSFLSYVQLH